ncbi:MAG: carboxylating nicotinate-nucleotide diphosphorylase [Deltaproteobacteria bacterium]|nr:carboxylating nicotinate-nucleotide diphosphorylase [Deltaproteobacteria bacterium]
MSEIRRIIEWALAEDLGSRDVTSAVLFRDRKVVSGFIKAKESFTLAGIDVAREVFESVNSTIIFRSMKRDGDKVEKGDTLAEMTGDVADLMIAERTALNFIQRLSGIATLTLQYTEKIRGSRARVADTRKTTPGLRALEKYAVKVGGGSNHRMGLYDGILIKDNHIAACGGIREAVSRAKMEAPHTIKVEVEVPDLNGVRDAVDAGADIIMLDNMNIDDMREAVRLIAGRALVEASGNITLDNISDVAFTGVDIISVGALTHSATAVDVSMRIEQAR